MQEPLRSSYAPKEKVPAIVRQLGYTPSLAVLDMVAARITGLVQFGVAGMEVYFSDMIGPYLA